MKIQASEDEAVLEEGWLIEGSGKIHEKPGDCRGRDWSEVATSPDTLIMAV